MPTTLTFEILSGRAWDFAMTSAIPEAPAKYNFVANHYSNLSCCDFKLSRQGTLP